jgi:hypothetical protein
MRATIENPCARKMVTFGHTTKRLVSVRELVYV